MLIKYSVLIIGLYIDVFNIANDNPDEPNDLVIALSSFFCLGNNFSFLMLLLFMFVCLFACLFSSCQAFICHQDQHWFTIRKLGKQVKSVVIMVTCRVGSDNGDL